MLSTKALILIIGPLCATCTAFSETHSVSAEHSPYRRASEATSPATRVDLTPAHIVGGVPAQAYTSYGFSVGQYLCGATLIHDDILLTAAHCEGVFLDGVFLSGTTIDGAESEEIMITEELPHEDFDAESYQNDIMIVKLAWTPEDPTITLQSFNTDREVPSNGDSLTAIGYGYTSEFGEVSPILREVDLDIVEHATCDSFYGTIVEETMVCTMTEHKDTCLGDSGGPLLDRKGVQVAITSFGRGCARKGSPGVYTRIASYSAWIEAMICKHSDVPPARCSAKGQPREPTESEVADDSEAPSTSPSLSPSAVPTLMPVVLLRTAEAADETFMPTSPTPIPSEEEEQVDDDDHASVRESLLSHCDDLESNENVVSNLFQRSFCTFFHVVAGGGRR